MRAFTLREPITAREKENGNQVCLTRATVNGKLVLSQGHTIFRPIDHFELSRRDLTSLQIQASSA
ncbi:MAG: hypothetical protein A3I07_03310 [Candidatus Doudnabacteria bacterium RIFCSPLOWO2_02_FULL_42_9]|nr:MAG: hypothetical protein A3E28_03285 [Candidatus Doudnabacteria bacterium RIFCSPHIGHO2_12_FULL_42_22]OGE87282.1 MAG: hypothetical protein A3C49_00910 [Candidatus Doudnabacteria bacterium RIFCSPHIGHO2_02_FULL_42_25]OGE92119.1 MAG: hypothetical protein A2895_00785 [Candidatus Doudnabacteria bacterium RIFCSPLOWO2_01_FULL_42_60]OGE98278.1 MAG: hypothetical protein A3G89_00505 [Candidatus Doudnabacteria bacterium RIFCSPLOWO2_12_FULL_42_9]OGF00081.1 MAG: hypothetical protein A3I07_03310 [Candidat